MSSTDLNKELDKALAEIKRLRRENEELKQRVKNSLDLNKESPNQVAEAVSINDSATSEEKIRVFKDYFEARDDVYAVRWTNRSGGSGYSPACYYEWDPAICKKPNGKCDKCKYIPLDNEVIRKH